MTHTSTEPRNKLLPCPFCGARARFEIDDECWEWVECSGCGIQGNRSASLMEGCKPKLAETWNRRAQVVPKGWKLVPEVADEKMQRAIAAQFNGTAREAIDAWSEALAAAPQPPEAAQLDDINVADIAQAVDSKEAAPVQIPEPVGVLRVFEPHEGAGVVCTEATINATNLSHGWHTLYTEHQVRQLLTTK